jgi:hypothetical protein
MSIFFFRDYVDLADEIGRKPFHKTIVELRTTPPMQWERENKSFSSLTAEKKEEDKEDIQGSKMSPSPELNAFELERELRGGGRASVAVAAVAACKDERVCSGMRNVCKQVHNLIDGKRRHTVLRCIHSPYHWP